MYLSTYNVPFETVHVVFRGIKTQHTFHISKLTQQINEYAIRDIINHQYINAYIIYAFVLISIHTYIHIYVDAHLTLFMYSCVLAYIFSLATKTILASESAMIYFQSFSAWASYIGTICAPRPLAA